MKISTGKKMLLLIVTGSMIFLHGCATTSSLNFNLDNQGKTGFGLCKQQSVYLYSNEKSFKRPALFGVCVYY
jgi:hypothetical protein